jgi:hypothetical protein
MQSWPETIRLKGRGLYKGYVFIDMDENLIVVFHKFIIERGLDEELKR